MSIRFPLYGKIVGWFFLNLLVLGVVFYAFFKIQFRLGLDSLLMGRAGDRIQAVSEILTFELNKTSRAEWTKLLQRFGDAYRVRFFLFRNNGAQVGGEPVQLPSEVLAKITELKRIPLLRTAPSPKLEETRTAAKPEAGVGPESPAGSKGAGLPVPSLSAGGAPLRFMLHTMDPGRYWVGVRIRVAASERSTPYPAVLLAMSDTLRGGGLFFDAAPWVGVGAGVLLISALFWFPIVRGMTRSVSQMTDATEEISAGRFEARAPVRRRDELGRLGEGINRLASRLAGFVTGQRRFLADIAHELCSPIARMEMAVGILEQRGDPAQKAYVQDVREEIQQMSSLVNELLSFSKASLGPAAVRLQSVPVRPLIEEAIRQEASGETNIQVDLPGELNALAAPELLLRALANLIRNARRYAGAAGPIRISGSCADGGVLIRVSDCGPGIPEECLAQIFDPFFRPERSRDRETGGFGLGLAIVKTCVEACQGKVSCLNRKPSGFEVAITLRNE